MKHEHKAKSEALKKKMEEKKECKHCGSMKHKSHEHRMKRDSNMAPSHEKGNEREGREEKEEEEEE